MRGRWLFLARVAWVALAAATLRAFVISILARYSHLSHPGPSVRAELAEVGLSAGANALYNVGLDAAFGSVFALGAFVIFWRCSSQQCWCSGER